MDDKLIKGLALTLLDSYWVKFLVHRATCPEYSETISVPLSGGLG
jgi:hypothetical protein